MKMIKKLSDEIKHNIHEAKEKIHEAYRLKDKDKSVADWYRDMASAHLGFNDRGHSCVSRLISESRTKHEHDPLTPGMLAVYEEIHSEVMAEHAEVQAMITAYK